MRYVFFISDRTGITADALGSALLTQFATTEFKREFISFVDTESKARQAIIKINQRFIQSGERPIIFSSIINARLRQMFKLEYACHIDFFASCIPTLEEELGQMATLAIGMSHGLTNEEKYASRISAINFSLNNDDGVSVKNYELADVILIGVSRVGKTPTCLYLAVNYGIKAANYPITDADLLSDNLPKILMPFFNKLFGLTIDLEKLQQVRSSRMPNSHYADINNCRQEIVASEKIMQKNNIPYLNTSKKSIEELSVAIMESVKLGRYK